MGSQLLTPTLPNDGWCPLPWAGGLTAASGSVRVRGQHSLLKDNFQSVPVSNFTPPISVPEPKTAHDLKQETLKGQDQSGKRLQKKGKNIFLLCLLQGALHFHFALGLGNYIAGPGLSP